MPTDFTWQLSSTDRADEFPDVASALASGSTALVLDLEPVVGVHIAADLSARRLADVVLVLPRWPHAEAILPTGELVGALVAAARRLRSRAATPPHVVFVLDGVRAGTVRRRMGDPRVDNRYDLAVGDLPTLQQLRDRGIGRIVKVVHPPTS